MAKTKETKSISKKMNISKSNDPQKTDSIEKTLKFAIEGIVNKKGLNIVYIDLKKINSSICDYFVICHGTSNTHVNAIAESVEEIVRENVGIKPAWREGVSNSEWVLLDYMDVVVHVFQENIRSFYELESLWADAEIIKVNGD